jgi:hypothetical protein
MIRSSWRVRVLDIGPRRRAVWTPSIDLLVGGFSEPCYEAIVGTFGRLYARVCVWRRLQRNMPGRVDLERFVLLYAIDSGDEGKIKIGLST